MPINEMYKRLKLLKLSDIYRYYLLRFIHYAMYDNTSLFLKHFAPLLPCHSYSTRHKRINLPCVRLEIEKNSVIFQCCKLLNDLPCNLLEPQSDRSLKIEFKNMCISNY